MAKYHQTPHFNHHFREAVRTRRRFRTVMAVLFALLGVAIGTQYVGTHAAVSETISGRVYNAATGVGLPNVRVQICNLGVAVSSSAGTFAFGGVDQGTKYCVRYLGGAPAGATGPAAVNLKAGSGDGSSYEDQVAGVKCPFGPDCTAAERVEDLGTDAEFDLVFGGADGSVYQTPDPRLSASKPADGAMDPLVGGTSGAVSAAGEAAPGVPANFQATVAGDNAVVSLSWDAATSDIGVRGYKLERSLDKANWAVVSDNISVTTYDDKSVAFGIHYYYRLSAVDQAGKVSGFTSSDVATPEFNSNTVQDAVATYTSDDSIMTAKLPVGTVSTDAVCSVSHANLPKDGKQPGTTQRPLVAGPYQLLCKTPGGDNLIQFAHPVVWSVNLKGNLHSLVAPKPYAWDMDGNEAPIVGSTYDDVTGLLAFSSVSAGEIVVLADVQQGVSFQWVVAIALVILVMLAVAVLIVRKQQKHAYDEYLRTKYYNL